MTLCIQVTTSSNLENCSHRSDEQNFQTPLRQQLLKRLRSGHLRERFRNSPPPLLSSGNGSMPMPGKNRTARVPASHSAISGKLRRLPPQTKQFLRIRSVGNIFLFPGTGRAETSPTSFGQTMEAHWSSGTGNESRPKSIMPGTGAESTCRPPFAGKRFSCVWSGLMKAEKSGSTGKRSWPAPLIQFKAFESTSPVWSGSTRRTKS